MARSAKQQAALRKAQLASAAKRKAKGHSPLAAAQKALSDHYATSASSDPKGWNAKAARLEAEVSKLKGTRVSGGGAGRTSMHAKAIQQGYYQW